MKERYIGRTDTVLTQKGVDNAIKLAKKMKSLTFNCILSSPSKRVIKTAEIATHQSGIAIEEDRDLYEIDFGEWEGMSFEEIFAEYPKLVNQWALGRMDFCFPNGESLLSFKKRISRIAQRIIKMEQETVAVFTHGGVIRFLLCHFLKIDSRLHLIFEISPGSITTLHFYDGEAVLSELNNRCHLEEF